MKKDDVLVCVFSYNMGVTLNNCLSYLDQFCDGFDAVVIDDNSTDPATLTSIEKWRNRLLDVIVNTTPKTGQKHGNLYANVAAMCDYARERGYKYLFMVQDDMQFVRPLDDRVLAEYTAIFASSERILQVDPRFLREGQYEVLPDIKAYKNLGPTSYADVGFIDLNGLKASGWTIRDGERVNRDALASLGYQRVFPFTPVVMHVPFPQKYRNGRLKRSWLLRNRGKYGFHAMSEHEILDMDARDVYALPIFRRFLRVRNMFLSRIVYWLKKDSRVLS